MSTLPTMLSGQSWNPERLMAAYQLWHGPESEWMRPLDEMRPASRAALPKLISAMRAAVADFEFCNINPNGRAAAL